MPSITAGYVNPEYLKELARAAEPLKRRIRELLAVGPAARVLDVGCGPGTDTLPIAAELVTARLVCGIDADVAMVRVAAQRAREMAGKQPVHLAANGSALPFRDNSFDACICDRVLQHAALPEVMTREMTRVTRPGGAVVLVDTDHASLTLSTRCQRTEEILRSVRTNRLRNGYAARKLAIYARGAGLTIREIECFPCLSRSCRGFRFGTAADLVESEALAGGKVSEQELRRYREDLEAIDRDRSFYSIAPMVIVASVKP